MGTSITIGDKDVTFMGAGGGERGAGNLMFQDLAFVSAYDRVEKRGLGLCA